MDAIMEQAEALDSTEAWPPLPLAQWKDTRDALHLWTQILGKIRLRLSPPVNHRWHSTLYVTPTGLTTSAIPWREGAFELRLDLVAHLLRIETSSGLLAEFSLRPCAVAEFQAELFEELHKLSIFPAIRGIPDEVEDRMPFSADWRPRPYDPDAARRFHRILLSTHRVLQEFRGRFVGKASPVHFFWGSFDLATTRFSGRRAPPRPKADAITREAYSHECLSAGFWPGGGVLPEAAFYAYAAPEPQGIALEPLEPPAATYDPTAHEFLLPYEAVRTHRSPRHSLLRFLQTTYEAGASLAGWDREALDRAGTPFTGGEDEGRIPLS
jgi:hypothetical protein